MSHFNNIYPQENNYQPSYFMLLCRQELIGEKRKLPVACLDNVVLAGPCYKYLTSMSCLDLIKSGAEFPLIYYMQTSLLKIVHIFKLVCIYPTQGTVILYRVLIIMRMSKTDIYWQTTGNPHIQYCYHVFSPFIVSFAKYFIYGMILNTL